MQLLPFDYGYSQCQVRYSGANNSAAGKHDTYMYMLTHTCFSNP